MEYISFFDLQLSLGLWQ